MNALEVLYQLGLWGQHHTREVLAGVVAAPLLVGAAHLARWHGRQRSDVMGSARWATPREVRRAGLMGKHGVVVGRLGLQILHDDGETHVLLVGPTRSRKGVGVIIPTLLTWRGSALVLDPKDGENLDVTGPWRSQVGEVAAFTPCRSPQTCINVCDLIRFGMPQEFGDALTIAQSLTAAEKQSRESATSLHFRELASLLLCTAQLHVGYTTGRCSLARVWDFLTQQHASLGEALKTMAMTAHTSHGVHQAIASMTTAIKNIAGDRELSSVWTTAIRPLALYNDPMIAASTDTSTIDLEDLQYGLEPLSLYLVAPSLRSLERLHPLYRVILDGALTRLTEHKVRTWRHRLLFCADELPAYGYCKASEKGAADMAGYGQKALFVVQDLDQLQDVYGERNAIWGNTEVKIFTAPTNDLTAKRISENFMGRGTVDHPVESRQAGLSGRQSMSFGHVGRPLLTTDEVMELDPRLQLVRMSGIKPVLCEKVDYRYDREYRGRLVTLP